MVKIDIIVCTTLKTLLHKQDKLEGDTDKSDNGEYFWYCWNIPKRMNVGDKMYVAVEGFVRGYFIVHKITRDKAGDGYLEFKSKTWHDVEPTPKKHSQGFTYCDTHEVK